MKPVSVPVCTARFLSDMVKFSRRGSYERQIAKTLIIESRLKCFQCKEQLQNRMNGHLNTIVMHREMIFNFFRYKIDFYFNK